jgi:hypothetical protein
MDKGVIMKAFGPDYVNINLPFLCEVHAPRFLNSLNSTENFKVYVDAWEPRTSCESISNIRLNANKLDLILTKDDSLLDLPNARLFYGGSSWVYPWKPEKKEFSFSFLCTSHSFLPGYRIRHELWENQYLIKNIPTKFFSSKWAPMELSRTIPQRTDGLNEKVELFYSMYSFCPENTQENNYFSEKILDCFATKTIPVYWGCPNIGNHFNINGIIIVKDIHDLFEKISYFSESQYISMLPYIEENYQKSIQYNDPNKRLEDAILKYYNEKNAK